MAGFYVYNWNLTKRDEEACLTTDISIDCDGEWVRIGSICIKTGRDGWSIDLSRPDLDGEVYLEGGECVSPIRVLFDFINEFARKKKKSRSVPTI